MAIFTRDTEVTFNGQTVLFGQLSPDQQQAVLDADYQAEYRALYGVPPPDAGNNSTGTFTGANSVENTDPEGYVAPSTATPTNNVDWYDAPAVDSETDAVLAAQAEAEAVVAQQNQEVDDQDPFEAARQRAEDEYNNQLPENFGTPEDLGVPQELSGLPSQGVFLGEAGDSYIGSNAGLETAVNKNNAQDQQTRQARKNMPSQADWRVRLQLARGADYLYADPKNAGILAPLAKTGGVIFPYTPTIETSYQAKYDISDLMHSNYRGYFYKNSYVGDINIRSVFTAQDSAEAEYLLAVIHFFRSVTKMFYGQDQQAGTPPPMVFLSGMGQFQFNEHPCVVTSFNYTLPNDVDYIRANGFNNYGLNLENRRTLSSGPSGWGQLGLSFIKEKLGINNLLPGGERQVPSQGAVNSSISNTTPTNSTYVPTKMEIAITLLPIQTRSQVSQQFSVKGFANGNLLKGGFW